MRTFVELRCSEHLHHARDTELGAEYWMEDGERRVRLFEHVGAAGMAAYVTLHECAHLWIHGDYDHDAWLVLDVDESIEIGVDFVVMPRRVGNTLDSFVRREDRAEPPPRLADLRALIPKLVAAAVTPADRWIAAVVANRLAGPDIHTIFVWAEQRFYIQDLAPSRAELDAWRAVAPPQA
jgi:hypothetical protein